MYIKTVKKNLKSGKQKRYYYLAEKVEGKENIIKTLTEEEAENFNENKVSPIAETSRETIVGATKQEIEQLRADLDKLKTMLLGNTAKPIKVSSKGEKVV